MSESDVVSILDLLSTCMQSVSSWFISLWTVTGFFNILLFVLIFAILFRFIINRSLPSGMSDSAKRKDHDK